MAIKVLEFRSDAPYQAGFEEGWEEGRAEGKEAGEKQLLRLLECLSKDNKLDSIVINRMLKDKDYVNDLYNHYQIKSSQEAEEALEPVKEAK